MKRGRGLALALVLLGASVYAQQPDSFYKLGPDSLEQPGVPHGKMTGPFTLPCKVYPGTAHTYWVYVPAQYDKTKPASLMVFNDGQAFKNETGDIRAQNVLDNLIHRREIPVMLGVFINPGKTPEQPEPNPKEWGDRTTNRPTEYNTPNDKYARIICDELLPALNKDFNISKDPEQRGIGGASSGAIAAFMVAWERPNEFRKVISFIGSFTNLRGGHVYPERVLASEKKPIRAFFQDGRNDNRGTGKGGKYNEKLDWFYQNVRLVDALTKKGYDVNNVWGIGGHSSKHGGSILPDMMRWLWRDKPVSVDVKDSVERSLNRPAGEKQVMVNDRWGVVVDPDGDCKFAFDKAKLTITVPKTVHDLTYRDDFKGQNAPRVLQDVDGDFRAQVQVHAFPQPEAKTSSSGSFSFVSSGLLIWVDAKNMIRLERSSEGDSGSVFVWMERFEDGKSAARKLTPIADISVFLKVERKGKEVSFAFKEVGAEEQKWTVIRADEWNLPQKLKVGVHAINTTTKVFSPQLEGLTVGAK